MQDGGTIMATKICWSGDNSFHISPQYFQTVLVGTYKLMDASRPKISHAIPCCHFNKQFM